MAERRKDALGREAVLTRFAIFGVFLASGAAGLIYEVTWFRLLTNAFGATLLAVSTVLASFMGGLALGSFVLGRVADRLRRPLRFYAILELGIGLSALAVPWLLNLLESASRSTPGDLAFVSSSLVRFGCNMTVLLVPTTLMGATLPVMSRFLVKRHESLGLNVGGLYTANTVGGVLGAFLAGFFLIATLGVQASQHVAVGLNVLVCLLAWRLSVRVESDETPAQPDLDSRAPEESSSSLRHPRPYPVVLATYGVSGFVALSYQVVWTRGLMFVGTDETYTFAATTYVFSAMLTVFLSGLALGSALMTVRVDRHPNPARLYGLLLLVLGITGGLSGILLFYVAPVWYPLHTAWVGENDSQRFVLTMLFQFIRALMVMGLPTFVMGLAFPAAAKLCVPDLKRVGGGVGQLYAFNTTGAIFGSFAAGFILIPALGMSKTILLLASLSALTSLAVFYADPMCRPRARRLWTLSAIATIALLALVLPPRHQTFQSLLAARDDRVLAFVEGPMATVSVSENIVSGTRTLAVDNIDVASTNRIMLTDQKVLAHLPALILSSPSSALTVGFGSGGTSYSYTLYDEFRQLDAVEIVTTVLRPEIQRLLTASNHGATGPPPRVTPVPCDPGRRPELPALHQASLRRHRDRLHRPPLQIQREPLRRRIFPTGPRSAHR